MCVCVCVCVCEKKPTEVGGLGLPPLWEAQPLYIYAAALSNIMGTENLQIIQIPDCSLGLLVVMYVKFQSRIFPVV